MDVDQDSSVATGVKSLLDTHGRIDAVVTCAGWGLAGPAETTPIDEARAQMETNFWGSVRVVAAVLPAMRRRRAGRIVLVSSIGGKIALPFQAFYSASKFALEGYGEALAYEVAPHGIEVTLIEPGNISTGFTVARRHLEDAADPTYGAEARGAVAKMERDERAGAPALMVAEAVERTITSDHPRRRRTVGKPAERLAPTLKRLLPHRLFEPVARRGLGL
jgi:NAD(P)-dependent dehydrogenase (short-subunit alcohol dehydrogenase family)